MNDDALAAVVAAAARLFAGEQTAVPRADDARWKLAARLPSADAACVRLVAQARSRWTMSGRLRD